MRGNRSIKIIYRDHPPWKSCDEANFHARYGEFEATIDIGALTVMQGQLPGRALDLVHEWGMMHREELIEAWRLCRENRPPAKIEPLN